MASSFCYKKINVSLYAKQVICALICERMLPIMNKLYEKKKFGKKADKKGKKVVDIGGKGLVI